MALRAKIGPDRGPCRQVFVCGVETRLEPENRGDPTIEGENEVWPDFHPSDFVVGDPGFAPQPEGTGPIFPILSSLVASVVNYSALPAPKTQKNWLPSPPAG